VVIACLKNIEAAWGPIEPIKTSLVRSEMNPQFAAIVLPTDLVIVTRFEIELEQIAGNLIVCLPYSMIEPLRSKLASGFQAEIEQTDLAWREMLESVILESTVELRIELGATEITGERLWLMQKGDIIQLDHDATDMLTGFVGDLPKIKGYAGVRRGFQAFRVEEKLKLK
jgi:flagellar motor switch protein FliM